MTDLVECQPETRVWPAWMYHAEIFVSAVFFALSTLLAKFVQQDHPVSAATITFFRFAIGLAILLVAIAAARTPIRPRKIGTLLLRGFFNVIAVFLFYYAIRYTTITNANLLNLTYPVFVAVLSPIVLGEHLRTRDWFILALAGAGIYLVINPNFAHVNVGDIIGLLGGITAGFSVLTLCFARRDNSTATVLLFLLGTGALLFVPAVLGEDFSRYTWRTWWLLFACGLTGVIGQFTITHAFRHLTAFAGSVTGMARVVIAALLGFFFLGERPTWNVAVGSTILFVAITLLASASEKSYPKSSKPKLNIQE